MTLSVLAWGLDVLELSGLASCIRCVRQVSLERDFTRVTSAVWKLNPFRVFVVFQLNNLNIRWVFLVLVDLNERGCWPLLFTHWLAVAIPIAVWTWRSISWINLSILMLSHLVLVILKWLASPVNSVIDLRRLPVFVVIFPLLSISLLSRFSSFTWSWLALTRSVRFAGSYDCIAQISLQWLIIMSQLPSAVW